MTQDSTTSATHDRPERRLTWFLMGILAAGLVISLWAAFTAHAQAAALQESVNRLERQQGVLQSSFDTMQGSLTSTGQVVVQLDSRLVTAQQAADDAQASVDELRTTTDDLSSCMNSNMDLIASGDGTDVDSGC